MEQKELAERLHLSNKTISSWECGRTEPNIGMIESLATVFGVSKSDLIDGAAAAPEKIDTSTDLEHRLSLYAKLLNAKGIEKLFERAEELRQMGYVKEGDRE